MEREAALLGTETVGRWQVEKLWLASEPEVRISDLPVRQATTPRTPQVTIVLSANGKNDIFGDAARPICEENLNEERAVLSCGRTTGIGRGHTAQARWLDGRTIGRISLCSMSVGARTRQWNPSRLA